VSIAPLSVKNIFRQSPFCQIFPENISHLLGVGWIVPLVSANEIAPGSKKNTIFQDHG
jgi:hypothetical protein